MIVSEYEAIFHECSRYSTTIWPTEKKKIEYFVRGLQTQLWIKMYLLVIVGRSFLEIVDHTHMIEQLYCVVHKDNDKQARYV